MEMKYHGSENSQDAIFMQHDNVQWLIGRR